NWSPKQAKALDTIAAWLRDPNGKQTLYLAGVAGSGESTRVEHIVRDLDGKIVYCAPTGKAAHVMRRKGCPTATTVHKAIYLPAGDPPSHEQIEKLRAECKRLYAINDAGARASADKIAEQLQRAEADSKRKGPRFTLNLDAELRHAAIGI